MSFSFSSRGATKLALLAAIAIAMSEVVKSQPIHAKDEPLVNATAESYAQLLDDDESREMVASVNGWINTTDGAVTGVCVGVSLGYATGS